MVRVLSDKFGSMTDMYEVDHHVFRAFWIAYHDDNSANRTLTADAIAEMYGCDVDLVNASIGRLASDPPSPEMPRIRESAAAPGRWLLNVEWVRRLPEPDGNDT